MSDDQDQDMICRIRKLYRMERDFNAKAESQKDRASYLSIAQDADRCRRIRECLERDELLRLSREMRTLIGQSDGVAGFHKSGSVMEWSEDGNVLDLLELLNEIDKQEADQ